MADTKISALSAGTALAGTEEAPFVQSAATVKITPAQIRTYVQANMTTATITTGTITSSTPGINLTQTWNAGGVTFSAATINITRTAAAANSTALAVQVGGANVVRLCATATGSNPDAILLGTGTDAGIGYVSSHMVFGNTSGIKVALRSDAGTDDGILKVAGGSGGFGFSSAGGASNGADLRMQRGAANVLTIAGTSSAPTALFTRRFAVSALPTASSFDGAIALVSDATATTVRSTVAGGGANKVMVQSDGTNWLIVA